MKTILLNKKVSIFIQPKPPFNFDGTFHKPSHFLNKLKLENWVSGKYWQTIWVNKRLYGLKIENKGTVVKPAIRVSLYSRRKINSEELERLKHEIIWRFELDKDLTEFNKMAKEDERFYPVFKKWIGTRNSSQFSLYELLIISIVLQNATVLRSQQMLDALLEKYGIGLKFDNKKLYSIWLPEKLNNISEEELRSLKIGYRARFIKKLSCDFSENKIDEFRLRNLDAEFVKKELMKLYGVGPETARILLFEVYHHYDVFDHIAPWQQKIYSQLFYNKRSVPVERIRNHIKKSYGKYSMLAVHYIWEDIFWRRKNRHISWLEKEIRV